MTSKELRQKYLDFFASKEHSIIPSASLMPENDPTVLFTTAGMHPLVPYLMGEKHPAGAKLANSQKCIRTSDIDEVGDNRHLTFFEMLGNWSLGDYFKKEAIEWSWEFLTSEKWLNLDPGRLYVTVFMGDGNIGEDNDSIKIWQKQFASAGLRAEVCPYNQPIGGNVNLRIFPLPAKDNWWGPAGRTGPCGPCTEMFYDSKPQLGAIQKTFDEEINDFRVMEVWNDVFMQYNKTVAGKFELLRQKNVDTGMGLERTISVLNEEQDAFANDLFTNIFFKIEQLSGKKYVGSPETTKAMRIVADHLKAAAFIMGDDRGVTPSNTDQGYVARRLIRRAIRYGKQLGITESPWTKEIAKIVAHDYAEIYPELQKNIDKIIEQFKEEEIKFAKTIEDGLKKTHKILKDKKPLNEKSYLVIMQTADKKEIFKNAYKNKKTIKKINEFAITMAELLGATISGKEAFNVYQTYGFPIETIIELAQEARLFVDIEEFNEELEKHQTLSRTASAGMFKGGLADASEATIRYHTAAHLLLASLRKVLGGHVIQKGSNITAERLRFDFAHKEKMTDEEKQKVEDLVNRAIEQNLPVTCEEMTLDQARDKGAHGIFDAKYGEKIKVYTIGGSSANSPRPELGTKAEPPFSREICGGPHVANTGRLGHFKIQKEESSSSGVRRIKAILE